jgi:hypothetical protein
VAEEAVGMSEEELAAIEASINAATVFFHVRCTMSAHLRTQP